MPVHYLEVLAAAKEGKRMPDALYHKIDAEIAAQRLALVDESAPVIAVELSDEHLECVVDHDYKGVETRYLEMGWPYVRFQPRLKRFLLAGQRSNNALSLGMYFALEVSDMEAPRELDFVTVRSSLSVSGADLEAARAMFNRQGKGYWKHSRVDSAETGVTRQIYVYKIVKSFD